ncbi:MAG TPA: Rieske 2Fe-2S domain-containing protein [Candidatus Limnocylindria bacterium]|nr:Rieske 2Fe-2S domain-containing protein [Candidatus Limnocylindria bacterium]
MKAFDITTEAHALREGQAGPVEVHGKRLALVRLEGKFYALDNACPHRGGPLAVGYLDGCRLHCPLHGWGFDVTSGACDVRPELPVATYPVEVREGRVWVRLAGEVISKQ